MIFKDTIIILLSMLCIVIYLINKNTKIKYIIFLPFILVIIHNKTSNENLLFNLVIIGGLFALLLPFINNKKLKYCLLTIILLLYMSYPISTIKYNNYSSLSYLEAFQKLHKDLKENYVLNDYKKIDYDKLYNNYYKLFKDVNNNEKEYYLMLEKYLNEFYDAHINIKSITNNENLNIVRKEYYNNYYGFSIMKLDEDIYVATNVNPSTLAHKNGIRNGTIITKWNKINIKDAIKNKQYLYLNSKNLSDNEVKNYYLGFYLSDLGEDKIYVTYLDENKKEIEIQLNSIEKGDDYVSLVIDKFTKNNQNEENFLYKKIKSTGYLKITHEKDSKRYVKKKLNTIINKIQEDNVKNLIIDLRNNDGGSDLIGSTIMSFFTDEKFLYLKECIKTNNKYKIKDNIYVNGNNKIDIPIIVLINGQTISAGEALTYNLKKLENVKVAGLTGSNGSASTIGKRIIMPHNILISIPTILLLNEKDEVIIDSNEYGYGGIKPDIKIPIDNTTINNIFDDSIDYELEYVLNYFKKDTYE